VQGGGSEGMPPGKSCTFWDRLWCNLNMIPKLYSQTQSGHVPRFTDHSRTCHTYSYTPDLRDVPQP